MKSVVIHAEGDVRVEERPLPQLQAEDDVLVKVVSAGRPLLSYYVRP